MTPYPTATPYTEEGYQGVLKQYLTDLKSVQYSNAQFTSYFYRQILREKVLAAVTADVARDSDYAWARHILVMSPEEAQAVLDRLNDGEDWTALASELSLDTSNKDQGGDLGWFTSGAMVAEFEDATFALEIGEISQPVQTSFGYHIIQLLGRETRPATDTEYQNKQNTAFSEWLTEKRTELSVETFDDVWMNDTPIDPELPAELIMEQQ
jgi:parvulin-like peptidyl-prolyl isomerase